MIRIYTTNPENSSIRIRDLGLERDSSEAHWGPAIRDFYIFHYIINGSGYFNGQLVKKGQGFTIKKNALHEYHSNPDDPWQYFWFMMDADEKYLEDCFANTNVSLDNCIFDFSFLPELMELIKKVLVHSSNMISHATSLSFFYSLVELHESTSPQKTMMPSSDIHIQKTILYMENNYYKNIKISDIAHSIFVDDRYLYNLFIKKLNISPKAYLNNIRISKACNLLTETSLSIATISKTVGYDDQLSFSKFFKKHIGISPIQYRNNSGEDKNQANAVPEEQLPDFS